MGTRDRRVDEYIARSPRFAQPILVHLRALVHEGCPEVEENIKWRMPSFEYRGLLCGMAAFKQHCVFGFRRGAEIVGPGGRSLEAMGSFGRIASLADLPPRKVLIGCVRKAMALNESGTRRPMAPRRPKRPLAVPDDLAVALRRNRRANAVFAAFAPSHRREYVEWITEAKRDETRQRRIATAIEWLAAGKARDWRYQRTAKTKTSARAKVKLDGAPRRR